MSIVGNDFQGILFSGKINFQNAKEIVQRCPQEFKEDSKCTKFVAHLITLGSADPKGWKWKKNHSEEHSFPKLCVLLGNKGIPIDERIYLGSWMIREMLEEIPEI